MRGLLAVARALDWTWEIVVKPTVRVLLALCVAVALLILFCALLAGLFVAVAKVWPS